MKNVGWYQLIFSLFVLCLQNVMNGMHVIYVPPAVLKNSPAMWLQMVTKHRGKKTAITLFVMSNFLTISK